MTAASKRERIVVYRLGSLGDTVVALPALHAVARAFPDAERIMLTNIPINAKAAPLEAILGGSGLIDRYIDYPLGTRSLQALWTLGRTLRSLDARTLVYLTSSRGLRAVWRDVLFFRYCGFERVVGAPWTRALHDNRRGADGFIERECERLARTLHPLGPIDLHDPAGWDLHLTDAERASAAVLLESIADRPRIAINMGGKVAKTDWGHTNWQGLVTALRATHGDHALLFVGSAEDVVRAEAIATLWPGPVVNLCGRVSPRVSAAALAGSRAFVGHDSGPMHLAACNGVACVSMFGNNDEPRKWHPLGTRHRIIHDRRDAPDIPVAEVLHAVLEVLSAAPAHRAAAPAPTAAAQ